MRPFAGLLLVFCLAACDPSAPPPATWDDLDASRPDGSFRVGSPSVGGGGGGGGGTTRPPECGARVLVVFDRSGSMNEAWTTDAGEEAPRWQVASDALTAALEPLAARIVAGAILFPTSMEREPGLCAEVDPIGAQLPFRDGAAFLSAWRALWAHGEVGGSTPLDVAFRRADEALPIDDEVTAVVVLTDGMPTCAEATAAWDYAAEWSARGVQTWVVGLPGAFGVDVLDQIAAAGGTGAALSVDDPAALTSALSGIVGDAVDQACP
ncbi:MAG: VWA domain-containing protein [Sandaracinaceae bacterium]|nr:VWA domain-containing protein [Sandaracinaceae bacterium]